MDNKTVSLIKSVVYRFYSTLITFTIAWSVTGKAKLALGIASVDFIVKIATYWGFERIWYNIKERIILWQHRHF